MSSFATKIVQIVSKSKKGNLPAFFTPNKPESPGVIVIQEWWGVNDQIKRQALDWFHDKGYCTIVPDLYRGEVAIDNEKAGHLMGGLDWNGAVLDIEASADYLLQKSGAPKVGVVGFCMGGALSLASSVLLSNINCAAAFYGIPKKDLADPINIKVPVQLHFGKNDDLHSFSSPKDVDALESDLKKSRKNFEIYRDYEAGHAFANSARPEVFNQKAADLAKSRVRAFFKEHLRK